MNFNLEEGAALLTQRLALPADQRPRISLLGETPGLRTVVRYRFKGLPDAARSAEELQIVGKFYADGAEGMHCFRSMAQACALLSRLDDAVLAIPSPLFYDEVWRFLALEWVRHRPYPPLVAGQRARACLRLAGRALADLHGLPASFGSGKGIADHLQELITPHPLVLAEQMPFLGSRLRTLVAELLQLEKASAETWQPTPIHRDFHLRQLFFGARRVWLIDWDQCALGDPSLDVGNFLVYLETHVSGEAAAAGSAFLEAYLELRGPGILERLPQFRAFTYLRLCCKAWRLQRPGWEERVHGMLDRAEAALAGGPAS